MYFERLRAALRRDGEGVHVEAPPASAAAIAAVEKRLGRPLPSGLLDLYRSWDGLRLFVDSVELVSCERLEAADDGALRIGEALGAPLVVDDAGRLYEEGDAGDRLLAGSTVEKWLDAVAARESLVFDREGEFKDVFDGEELKVEVRRKRARAGLKADPGAAAWHLELAELAVEEGDAEEAEAALRRALALDPRAGAAWALLGGLERRAARHAEAEAAWGQAAAAAREPARKAECHAEAARAAGEAGHAVEAAAHALAARTADPELAGRWMSDAERLAEDGDLDGALERASLAAAVEPTGAAPALVSRLRARRALKVL